MCCMYGVIFVIVELFVFFFKQKTAYEMRISDWSSDVCSSELGIVEGILDPRFLIARHGDEFGSAEVVTDRPAHDAEARAERLGHETILGEIARDRRRIVEAEVIIALARYPAVALHELGGTEDAQTRRETWRESVWKNW